MNDKIELYVLTHKEVKEPYDKSLYVPLVCGAVNTDKYYGYLHDDTGDNISHFNQYYAELTGEYWAWKNSKADIIGFCHYRRWFVKNIKWEKITKEDIINDLKEYDIILPKKRTKTKTLYKQMKVENSLTYGAIYEDYIILEKVIREEFNDYYDTFKEIMSGKSCSLFNMFICDKKLADEYFKWVFEVFNKTKKHIDFQKYAENNRRVFAFFGEQLLYIWVKKNNLKIKEYDLYYSERKIPILSFINIRFPILFDIEFYICKFLDLMRR